MRHKKKRMHRPVRILLTMLLLSTVTVAAGPQTVPDFSGLWKQDNDRCQPKRSGEVTLHIEHHDPELTVETSISHGSLSPGHAVQKYTTDGRASLSTGADGDDFHTSIVWTSGRSRASSSPSRNTRTVAFFTGRRRGHSLKTAQYSRELASAQMERNRFSSIVASSSESNELLRRGTDHCRVSEEV
jgi:hypothetical protein